MAKTMVYFMEAPLSGKRPKNPGTVQCLLNVRSGKHSLAFSGINFLLTTVEAIRALKKSRGKRLDKPVVSGGSALLKCFTCSEEPRFVTDGMSLWPEKECEFSKGIPLEVTLNVPSGRMVVLNGDVRDSGRFKTGHNYDIEIRMDRYRFAKDMERLGSAHVPIGGGDPCIYQVGVGKYKLAEYGLTAEGRPVKPKGRMVAETLYSMFCTVMDGEDFDRRGFASNFEDAVEFEVKPGVYRFRHYSLLHTKVDETKPYVFTDIEWISQSKKAK